MSGQKEKLILNISGINVSSWLIHAVGDLREIPASDQRARNRIGIVKEKNLINQIRWHELATFT